MSANLTSMCCRRVTNTLAGERMSVMHTSTFATNHSRHGLTTSHYVVHTSIGVKGISLICACPEPSFPSALPTCVFLRRCFHLCMDKALPTHLLSLSYVFSFVMRITLPLAPCCILFRYNLLLSYIYVPSCTPLSFFPSLTQ